MKPKPRSATTFLMVPVATVTSNIFSNTKLRTHDQFEKESITRRAPHSVARTNLTTLGQLFERMFGAGEPRRTRGERSLVERVRDRATQPQMRLLVSQRPRT